MGKYQLCQHLILLKVGGKVGENLSPPNISYMTVGISNLSGKGP